MYGRVLTERSLQTAANGVALLCVGRVVGGISVGIASAIVPVYQSEIAPKEIRGRVVSLQQWAITWYDATPSYSRGLILRWNPL